MSSAKNLLMIAGTLISMLAVFACDSEEVSVHDKQKDELSKVIAATEKYRDVGKAIEDGYIDINLVMPKMGAHFLKESLLDEKFEVDKPEILVYTPTADGKFMLTAVEYAVPVEMAHHTPEGFTGTDDVWVVNTDFNLWVLHAWIWYDNPEGIFNATNSRVP